MKKAFLWTLGLFLVLVVSLLACQKGQEKNTENSPSLTTMNDETIIDKKLVADFDTETNEITDLKVDVSGITNYLLENNIYTSVELVEVSINNDSATNEKVAYFTLMGTGSDGKLLAYQCDLIVDGGSVYMQNPEPFETFGTTHSCSGRDCSACAFRKDKNGQIYGCTCTSGYSICGHTISTTTKAFDLSWGWEVAYASYLM